MNMKSTNKSNYNSVNPTKKELRNNSQPEHIRNCPPNILRDGSLSEQKRDEMCIRYVENKSRQSKLIKIKPTPKEYCSKIKSQKSCLSMKKCNFINKKCSEKRHSVSISSKATKKRQPQRCKKCGQIRKGHTCSKD